jgi:hypothetical protein
MMIAASRYVAIRIDLPRLVASGRQAKPGTDGTRRLKVVWFPNGGCEGGRRDRTDAGNRHKYATGLAFTSVREELASELGGPDAQTTPSFQYWQHDRSKSFLIGKKASDIFLKCASLTRGNEQTERFHEPTDLVRKLGSDPDQSGTCRYKRAVNMLSNPFTRTSRKKPTSARCAKPSASFASVLLAAISSAALAWRASIQIAGNPSAHKA